MSHTAAFLAHLLPCQRPPGPDTARLASPRPCPDGRPFLFLVDGALAVQQSFITSHATRLACEDFAVETCLSSAVEMMLQLNVASSWHSSCNSIQQHISIFQPCHRLVHDAFISRHCMFVPWMQIQSVPACPSSKDLHTHLACSA